MTVIESARRAAGLSQRRLAEIAGTQQSSVSEYESRRKSPTLEVVERLLDAADAELAVRPMVFFDYREDPGIGSFAVPDRLWSVPVPDCFARVQVLKYLFHTDDHQIWDLSNPTERIEYYELVLVHGLERMLLDSVDGVLLVQAWPHLRLPDVVREAWQPVIDAATASQDGPPRDPGELSARIAGEIGIPWPPPTKRSSRR
jgi:transcriptional regulator with XRE-family HTH domain